MPEGKIKINRVFVWQGSAMPDYLIGFTIETNNLHYVGTKGNVLIGTAQLLNDLYNVLGCNITEPSEKVKTALAKTAPEWMEQAIKLPISMSHRFVNTAAAVSAALPFDKTNDEKFFLVADAINYILTAYGGTFDFEFASEHEFVIKQIVPEIVQIPSETEEMLKRIQKMKFLKEKKAAEYAKTTDMYEFDMDNMLKMINSKYEYDDSKYEYDPKSNSYNANYQYKSPTDY